MTRSILRRAVLPVIVLLFFALLIAPELPPVLITFLIGWWPSVVRLTRGWHPSSTGVVLFVTATILLVAGTHRFLNWVYCARTLIEHSVPGSWRWKWTFCGFGVIYCTLLAICAMILTTHQVFWISRSSDPFFTDPFRERARAIRLTLDLQKRAEESKWDTAKTREFFQKGDFMGASQSAAEAVQPVWIEKDDHSLQAIVLIPRRPSNRATARVTVLQPGTATTTHRVDELPQVLASFNLGSLAKRPVDATPPLR